MRKGIYAVLLFALIAVLLGFALLPVDTASAEVGVGIYLVKRRF